MTNWDERFEDLPRGKIAAIATSMELTRWPAPRPERPDAPGTVEPVSTPDVDWYLEVYRRVGADHLWFSRLFMERETLIAVLSDAATYVARLTIDGRDEGLLELDFSEDDTCEIKYFGVTVPLQGTGAARRLMNHALATAKARGVGRVWLHTNTLDHPNAMGFYRRTGFTPVSQQIEVADDPRLRGVLPMDAAPHVPIFPIDNPHDA
ncbi:GNAT family N-acetyltransferase [Aureimonas frigidaquae]|uniref:Acetyltransferase, GNAT family protein n=1 Tax=Aureimonas frigidaquae TaxID=424757 RepID=A0A0N7KXR1_9HYPH|nr:GNAT family N-acetyltransferase [Aureimonas frigidaquae]BAT27625.1 acetyltransferase, GNAT family protein [Aureimonas frigidaquae]